MDRPADAPALPRVLGPIRPRPRWLELRLLGFVAVALLVGSLSLGATVNGSFRLYDVQGLLVYLAALLAAHLAQVLAGRRTDQVLLPTIAMLGGISLLLMERLPQDLVTQTFFGTTLGLAEVQLVWLLVALAIATTLGIVVRSDSWLRRYKYTWAAAGVGLLLLTFVFGTVINGQRLTLQIGPLGGQPTELLKVILVVFLAGYLSENRALIVEQDTRLGPLRLPPLPYLAPMLAMWAIALVIVVIQRDLGAALLFFGVFLAMLYVATGRLSLVIIGLVLFLLGSALMANLIDHVRTTGRHLARSVRRSARCRLPGRPGAPRVRARRPARGRSRRRAAGDRRSAADPERPHGLPAGRARRGARHPRGGGDPRAVPGRRRARPADRGGRRGRLPVAPRGRARAGDRHPGVHHRGRQPQGPAADRSDAAVHQLRRVVAARQRARRRPAAGAVGQGCRATAGAARRLPLAADPRAGRQMIGSGATRRPLGRTTIHVAIVLSLAFALLAGAAGYWGVAMAPDLVTSPDDAAVIAAARTVTRGLIKDRTGKVLASNKKDANGESHRVYVGRAVSQVVGYASSVYGRAGLERSYDAELTGLSVDPLTDAFAKFGADRYDPQDLTLSLSYDLQRAAVTALGKRRGAIVMLDPRTGEVLALASTPTYDASAIADPATAKATFEALQADPAQPLLPRATLGRYVPGSVFKIVTAVAGLGSQAITPATTYKQQPGAEKNGLLVDGYRVRDGHHPATGSTALDLTGATEVSCNIYYALTGLQTGGAELVELRQADGLRRPAAVRSADRRVAGDRRQRIAAGRLPGRRRARERGLRPGRDVRDTAPDGARRRDRGERRGADASRGSSRP